MTERLQIYECGQCGNQVAVLRAGTGRLVCCDEPMTLLEEKSEDAVTEKHVPYIERTADGVTVRVGRNAAHPMEERHHIEWIELVADGVVHRAFLQPGDAPEAKFAVVGEDLRAREHCNVHGLWRG